MTEKVKSCPFCGGEAKCIEFYGMYHVICCDCYIAGRDTSTRDKAIESWNSRPIEDALQKELNEAREDNVDNMEYHVAERERLKKEIEELEGSVAFAERMRVLDLLKTCCNEFAPRNSYYPVCCRNEWGVDAKGHCLGKGECPIYAELTKGAKNEM